MLSTEEGAVALWMREENQTYWWCGEHPVMSNMAPARSWDGIGMELIGGSQVGGGLSPLPSSLPCVMWTPRSLLSSSSIVYHESLYSVTQVADINPWPFPPPLPPGPRVLLGQLYSWEPLRHQLLKTEMDRLPGLFLSHISGFWGFLDSAGLMTFWYQSMQS